MDSRVGRALIGLAALAAMAGAGELARARQADQPIQTVPREGPSPGPPPAAPPGPNGVPPSTPTAEPGGAPNGAIAAPSPAPDTANAVNTPSAENAPEAETPPATPAPAPASQAKAAAPPAPPPPGRGPTAILQVLDKVTAETLKFEAPVGRRVRYKTLVFTVRVCEVRGADDPQPRPSAYVVIDSEAPALPGHAAPPAKEVFRGWMFANGPGLHPLEHPIYDAWLVACSAAAPVS